MRLLGNTGTMEKPVLNPRQQHSRTEGFWAKQPHSLSPLCASPAKLQGLSFSSWNFGFLEASAWQLWSCFKENLHLLQHPEQLFKTKITKKQEMGIKELLLILLKNKYSQWTQECWVRCCARSTTKDAKHELSQADAAALWVALEEHQISHSVDLRKQQWDHTAKSTWKQEDAPLGTTGLT